MDPEAPMRRLYELLNAGDVDGFGELLADDFVEHEALPGLTPTKEGSLRCSGCTSRRSPTCGWSRRTF